MPRIHFHQQLNELRDKILAIAAMAQQAVETAVDAYLQRDAALCQLVRQTEKAIDSAQRELDEMAYDLLAKEQPMAVDLRFILAVIKIGSDLERIGDQSGSIARRTKEFLEGEEVDLPVDFAAMGEYAVRMIRSSIHALLEADADVAEQVLQMDNEIDEMNARAHVELLEVIQNNPAWTKQAMSALLISRYLERIADHATNIAIDVIFWVRGADVRHPYSVEETEAAG